jgi:signal transduction histidine kinase
VWDGIAVDITERVEMEEALREADRKKDEFIALLGHELRNPLAPIRNGLQVMRLAAATRRRRAGPRHDGPAARAHGAPHRRPARRLRIGQNKMELRRARVLLADVVATPWRRPAPRSRRPGTS